MSCETNDDCSGHGVCNQTCKCFMNYKGDDCNECKSDGYQKNTQGYCLQKCDSRCDIGGFDCTYDSDFKMNLCNCEIKNANPDEDCMYCIDGYHGTTNDHCQPSECVQARELCGGQGKCEKIDGKFACDCQGDFTGTFCENCKNGKIKTYDGQCLPEECVDDKSHECGGFGKCDQVNLVCVCQHGYKSNLCQDCEAGFRKYSGYYDTACYHEICFFEDETDPCSNNGTCKTQGTESYCECMDETTGLQCQDCHENFEKLNNGYCLSIACVVDGLDCGEHGYCSDRNGVYECNCHDKYDPRSKCSSCVSGYADIDDWCISDQCVLGDTECSFHGYCLTADYVNEIYKCVCEEPYKGEFCDECNTDFIQIDGGVCTKQECIINGTECSMNGYCYESYSSGWSCRCSNSQGNFCETCSMDYFKAVNGKCIPEDCFAGGDECGGHGTCSRINYEHTCVCKENFSAETRCVECEFGFSLKGKSCVILGGNKLSGGAIAGIVIAVLILIAAIGVGVGFGMKAKKNKAARQDGNKGSVMSSHGDQQGNLI